MVFCNVQVFSVNHKSFANFQMVVRLVQAAVFLGIIAGAVVALVLTKLTIGDIFASALSLIPTGWGLLSVSVFVYWPHLLSNLQILCGAANKK